MRMMMAHSRLYKNLNTGIRPECAAAMTKQENTMVKLHENKCDYKKLYRKMPGYGKCIRKFGEMGVIHIIVRV